MFGPRPRTLRPSALRSRFDPTHRTYVPQLYVAVLAPGTVPYDPQIYVAVLAPRIMLYVLKPCVAVLAPGIVSGADREFSLTPQFKWLQQTEKLSLRTRRRGRRIGYAYLEIFSWPVT